MGLNMKNDNLMELIVQHSSGGYIVTDTNGTIIFINSAYCKFLGKSAKDVVGKPIVEVLPNSHLQEVAKSGTSMMGVWQKTGGRLSVWSSHSDLSRWQDCSGNGAAYFSKAGRCKKSCPENEPDGNAIGILSR